MSRPATSLSGKFCFFVLLATLLTALAVTLVSAQSTRSFLYSRLEHKLPGLLQRTAEKIDFLYQQRLHEVDVFADAKTVAEGVSRYEASRSDADKKEIGQFLHYVLQNSPQFETLFALDESDALIVQVGRRIDLDDADRLSLAHVKQPSLSSLLGPDHNNIQIASAPVSQYGDKPRGSLHAAINVSSLQPLLLNEDLSEAGTMFLLDHDGRYIVSGPGSAVPAAGNGVYDHTVPHAPSPPTLNEYRNGLGQDVLGSAIYLPRIDGALVVEEPYDAIFAPVSSILWRTLGINLAIVLVFSAIAYRVARSITRPIHELSEGVRRISEGETDVAIPETRSNDEIGVLTQAFNAMTNQIDRNTKALERLSSTDELTQLHNYRFFKDYLSTEADTGEATGQPLALVLCDIDHFKEWNDKYGHARGDEILSTVAQLLKNTCRDSDLVTRYGGDEFAILAPNTNIEGALALAETLRTVIADAGFVDDNDDEHRPLTISTGVSIFNESRDQLFEEADRALFAAKRAGRNCVRAAGVLG